MAVRTKIHTDGTFNGQTGVGGWAAVVARSTAGRREGTSSYEIGTVRHRRGSDDGREALRGRLRPRTGIGGIARRGMTPRMCKPLCEEFYAAAAGKGVQFKRRKRDQSLGPRLGHQLSQYAARGR